MDFKAPTMPFKRLITGKRQPGRPGRSSEARRGSSRSLEDVTEMEGGTPAKRTRKATSATAAKATPRGRGKEKQIVRRSSKSSEQIDRTVRLDIRQGAKQNPQCS